MNKRRAISWHPTSSRMNRRKRLRKARKKKGARFAVKSEAIKRPRIQLKQQIQPRSLSDSCSSSRPGQLMMNRRGSTSASMGEKGKHTHTWTAAEELFLLTPFSTDPAAEKERFMASKSNYHLTAARKMNEKFGDNSPGWVPFSADKIKSKLRNFADRYNYYREKGHPYVNKVPSEPYKQVEYYIAQYGWIFVERPCPSRSGSGSRSRLPSASSRSVSKQQKTSHIPVNLDDEADIEAAGKYMLKHGDSDVNFFWYLKALHETIVRKGFWMLGDDFEKRKNYLDGLLPMLKKQWNVSE